MPRLFTLGVALVMSCIVGGYALTLQLAAAKEERVFSPQEEVNRLVIDLRKEPKISSRFNLVKATYLKLQSHRDEVTQTLREALQKLGEDAKKSDKLQKLAESRTEAVKYETPLEILIKEVEASKLDLNSATKSEFQSLCKAIESAIYFAYHAGTEEMSEVTEYEAAGKKVTEQFCN